MTKPTDAPNGQILVVVLILLSIMSVMVPLMVTYVQNEAKWTAKESRNTQAFHLAEAGTEKALLELTLSTQTWNQIQYCTFGASGTTDCSPTNYAFDRSYTDVSGGEYTVYITSGPGSQQATVYSIARDASKTETRSLKVIYSNATLGNIAIMGGNGVAINSSNYQIEWGAIVSPQAIQTNGINHPNFFSASSISGLTSTPAGATSPSTLPHCDSPNCWWWHSYYSGIPPLPVLDFNAYRNAAKAAGVSPCGMSYYQAGSYSGACSDLTGNTWFVEGDWTSYDGPSSGTMIVMGNFATKSGKMSSQNMNMSIPQQAWMQYCQDWAYYCSNYTGGSTGDNQTCASPHTSTQNCWGKNSTYLSPAAATYADSPVIIGFLYVGSNMSVGSGGGNETMGYGAIYVSGSVNLDLHSHVTWYYNGNATTGNLQTTQVLLNRTSWQDVKATWPSGLN